MTLPYPPWGSCKRPATDIPLCTFKIPMLSSAVVLRCTVPRVGYDIEVKENLKQADPLDRHLCPRVGGWMKDGLKGRGRPVWWRSFEQCGPLWTRLLPCLRRSQDSGVGRWSSPGVQGHASCSPWKMQPTDYTDDLSQ